MVSENLSVDTTNLGTSQTLHADETGTITLSHYTGDQTLTPVYNFIIHKSVNALQYKEMSEKLENFAGKHTRNRGTV